MDQIDEKFIENHCHDRGQYPLIFTKETGLDITIPNHPEYVVRPPHKYEARVEITTFRGTCFEAVHYYGRIYADAPYIAQQQENGGWCSVGGYLCEEWKNMDRSLKDLIGSRYEIELVRPVTRTEIEKDPDRWYGYEVGSSTNAFYSKAEIFSVAKKVIEYRFPGWEIKLDDWC